MTLEFDKVVEQVERMGRALAARNVSLDERAALAWERLQALGDLDAVHARIELARERDAGFRGAGPLTEPLNQAYPLPDAPAQATIIAADGSQVYPNPHAAALYYLINVGVFVYFHGADALPEQVTMPQLYYREDDVRDRYGQVITNTAVNARRSVQELATLAHAVRDRREHAGPLVAMLDGPLLFWVGKDVPEGHKLEREYLGWLKYLHDWHADRRRNGGESVSLIGYIDRPTSAFVVSLLHLMSLSEPEVRASQLESNGAFEGLIDAPLMFRLLKPGQRSALMVQQSPQNKRYHDEGESYEVVFFYLNVSADAPYHLARVELPMWVAREPALVDMVHALVYGQCQLMWRYPYALTRADELAVVRNHERAQLNEMIEIELRRNAQTVTHSEKLDSKSVRHGRTRYGQKRR